MDNFKGKTIYGIQTDSELIVIEDILINAGMKAGTDSFRTAMEIIMDPQVDIVKKYYECYKTCGFIDPNTKYSTDEYYYNEAYVAALDILAKREPNEQLWKDMQAAYKTNNTTYKY